MTTSFVRQLGSESGVQLNPLRDNSEIPTQDNADQVFGIMMRATRGRIDKPFKVDSSNVYKKIGRGEQIRVSALNEAWIHVVEALNNGAYEAVVQRLSVPQAVIRYAVAYQGVGATLGVPVMVADGVTAGKNKVSSIAVTNAGVGYGVAPDVIISGNGTGASAKAIIGTGADAGKIIRIDIISAGVNYSTTPTVRIIHKPGFAISNTLPVIPYIFAIKHLECFNDGIKVNFRADNNGLGYNSKINIVMTDSFGETLYDFTGSLLAGVTDDYGASSYLPDVISRQTDAVEIVVGSVTSISKYSLAYGYDAASGQQNWAKSPTLACFYEGGTNYSVSDYSNARDKLQFTAFNYAYISSGGNQSPGMLYQLTQLAFDTNRQLRFDIYGGSTIEQAITFVQQLNMGSSQVAHLMQAFYSPLKTDDPTGINGKGYYGVATLNIAYACLRNAQTDAHGFAPKNYPIAGRQWPILRTGVIQAYTPRNKELNDLARAKINPCLFEVYTGGGRYVFRDSLTSALVESSLKKLIAVADMSTSIDDAVTRYSKDVLQLPMDIAVKRTKDFLKSLFEGAQAAGWIVPSFDPSMNGKAFMFDVKPNSVNPYDRMDINYWLRYDGTVRQIFVTQTLTK